MCQEYRDRRLVPTSNQLTNTELVAAVERLSFIAAQPKAQAGPSSK